MLGLLAIVWAGIVTAYGASIFTFLTDGVMFALFLFLVAGVVAVLLRRYP